MAEEEKPKRIFAGAADEVRNLNDEIKNNIDTISEMEGKTADLAQQIMGVGEAWKDSKKYSEENVDKAKEQSKIGKQILDVIVAQNNGNKIQAGFAKVKLGFTRMFSKNLSKESKSLLDNYDTQQKAQKEEKKKTINLGKQAELVSSSAKGYATSLGSLLAIFGIQGGILGLLKGFFALQGKIGAKFGAIGMQTQELQDNLLGSNANAIRIGKSMDNLIAATSTLTDSFGFSLEKASSLAGEIIDTASALGISDQEAANLFGTLTQVAGVSESAATDMMKQTAALAKSAGVAPNAVLQDMAKSSETIAKFTGATPENISKAAIMAAKLGTNLDTVGKIMDGMLDFQSSIGKEIEASILLGKQLNFQKARELALNNDIQGAMNEVLGQLGSEEEFQRMNAIQRKALADALGVDVATMAQMISKQDEARSLNDALAAQQPLEKLIGEESLDGLAKIINEFKAIGAQLMVEIGPSVLSIVEGFGGFIKDTGKLKTFFSVIAGVLAGIAALSVISAVANIVASFAQIPFGLGIPLGLIAVGSLMAAIGTATSMVKSVGDVKNKAGGSTQISTGEGEIYNLSPNDDVVATPNLIDFLDNLSFANVGDVKMKGTVSPTPPESFDNNALPSVNYSINNTSNQISSQEQKQIFQDVMTPLFTDLKNSVNINTTATNDLKKVQEDIPKKTGESIAENMTLHRY